MLKYKAMPASNKIRLAIFKNLTVMVLRDIWKNGSSKSVTAEYKKTDTKTLDTVRSRIPTVRNIPVRLGYFMGACVKFPNDCIDKRVSYITEKHSLQLSNRAALD